MALSVKQTLFINEYLKTFNATKAAKLAGYSGNENTLAVTGHELLRNPKISEVISRRLSEKAMSADEVLMRLAEQARAAYSDAICEDGTVDVAKLVSSGRAHLIKSIKFTESGKKNVEFYDAQAALEKLGRHHKLFVEQLEAKIDDKLDDAARTARIMALLNTARERRDRQAPESGPDDLATAAGATD